MRDKSIESEKLRGFEMGKEICLGLDARKLLQAERAGVDVDVKHQDRHPVMWALQRAGADDEAISELIGRIAKRSQSDAREKAAWRRFAVECRDARSLRALIESLDPSEPRAEAGALIRAAQLGDEAMVEMLLPVSDLSWIDDRGDTAAISALGCDIKERRADLAIRLAKAGSPLASRGPKEGMSANGVMMALLTAEPSREQFQELARLHGPMGPDRDSKMVFEDTFARLASESEDPIKAERLEWLIQWMESSLPTASAMMRLAAGLGGVTETARHFNASVKRIEDRLEAWAAAQDLREDLDRERSARERLRGPRGI